MPDFWNTVRGFTGQVRNYQQGLGNQGSGGNIFTHMQNPPSINWNYQHNPFTMSAEPGYSKPREYKEPNPWLTGAALGGGLLGMVVS